MFGVPARELPAFLAANGIADPTRVETGFVYRIPNAPARALADRVATLERENARLAQEGTAAIELTATGSRRRRRRRAPRPSTPRRARHAAHGWRPCGPILQALIILLVLAAWRGAAAVVADAAGRQRRAERAGRRRGPPSSDEKRTGRRCRTARRARATDSVELRDSRSAPARGTAPDRRRHAVRATSRLGQRPAPLLLVGGDLVGGRVLDLLLLGDLEVAHVLHDL